MTFGSAQKSNLTTWMDTIDRPMSAAFLALIILGFVLSLAASPAVALKKGLSTYHFVERHALYAAVGVVTMFAISLLSPKGVRRFALLMLGLALLAMVAVTVWGVERNGAQRWLSLWGHSIQPSEFSKPAFIVVLAWLFAEASWRKDMPALPLALLLWVALVGLLVLQPDIGQAALISTTAGALYILAGLSIVGALALAAAGGLGMVFAYLNFGHVSSRIDRFFSAEAFQNYQVQRAMQSFAEGGLFGRGPGEGTIKSNLPDAHTDFIFAVVAEEYGVVACLVIVALFAFIVLRALLAATNEPRTADRLALQGLAIVIGLQAIINIGVNTGMLPPKGMTLPFISAGGSSLLALSITAGMILALTRWRPDPARVDRPNLVTPIDESSTRERAGNS